MPLPFFSVRILSGVAARSNRALPAHYEPMTFDRGSIPSTGAQDRKMLQLQKRHDDQIRLKGEARKSTRPAIQLFTPDRIVLPEPQILYDPNSILALHQYILW